MKSIECASTAEASRPHDPERQVDPASSGTRVGTRSRGGGRRPPRRGRVERVGRFRGRAEAPRDGLPVAHRAPARPRPSLRPSRRSSAAAALLSRGFRSGAHHQSWASAYPAAAKPPPEQKGRAGSSDSVLSREYSVPSLEITTRSSGSRGGRALGREPVVHELRTARWRSPRSRIERPPAPLDPRGAARGSSRRARVRRPRGRAAPGRCATVGHRPPRVRPAGNGRSGHCTRRSSRTTGRAAGRAPVRSSTARPRELTRRGARTPTPRGRTRAAPGRGGSRRPRTRPPRRAVRRSPRAPPRRRGRRSRRCAPGSDVPHPAEGHDRVSVMCSTPSRQPTSSSSTVGSSAPNVARCTSGRRRVP